MIVIAGLGNPDRQYAHTRHNIGFDVIDVLSGRYGITVDNRKFRAVCGKGSIDGHSVLLVKPMTYMNASGEAVREIISYYKTDPAKELIIICDDINLDAGQLRIRERGSAGGHNGLKSIIANLSGSENFIRVRVGVGGKPDQYDLVDYVLGRFHGDDVEVMEQAREKAADAVADILSMDIGDVMSLYNKRTRKQKPADKEEE